MRLIRPRWVGAVGVVVLAAAGPCVVAPPQVPGVGWEWVPALSDEFNTQHANPRGDGLDDAKWWDDHPVWDGRLPSQFAAPNSWVDGDGRLNLRATPRAGVTQVPAGTDAQRNTHWIDTAAVVSKTRAQVGAYYEAAIKTADLSLPSSFGFRMNDFSEIDVIENIGRPSRGDRAWKRSAMEYNTHFYGPGFDVAEGGHVQMVDGNGDPLYSSENFITYAVWWKSPTEVIYYYNDLEVASVTPRARSPKTST